MRSAVLANDICLRHLMAPITIRVEVFWSIFMISHNIIWSHCVNVKRTTDAQDPQNCKNGLQLFHNVTFLQAYKNESAGKSYQKDDDDDDVEVCFPLIPFVKACFSWIESHPTSHADSYS